MQLAAIAHANRANKDPYSTFDHSLRTLENALDCARGLDAQFIYFSSSMVYGNIDGEAVTEERGEEERVWGSMIKQAIKRLHPGFNERAYGFRSFNDLLMEAQKRGLLKLEPDEKSGGYIVLGVE